jgi:hypothetical protein
MKKKVRVLRRKPSPCDEAESIPFELQLKNPEKEIQEVKMEKSDFDDVPTDFHIKNEQELNIIDGDFLADLPAENANGLGINIEVKME